MSKVHLNVQYTCDTFTYKLAKSGSNRRIPAVNSKPTGSLVNGTQLSVERQICCDDNCYFASNFRSERTCATDALPKKNKSSPRILYNANKQTKNKITIRVEERVLCGASVECGAQNDS